MAKLKKKTQIVDNIVIEDEPVKEFVIEDEPVKEFVVEDEPVVIKRRCSLPRERMT
jgi:hypothetical protein